MINSFPKIFAIGQRYTEKLFDGEVEITEKVDGSQIGFGVIDGTLHIRSKGATIHVDNPDKMFTLAVDVIRSIQHLLIDDVVYYGEYLQKPRHNVIHYGRVPQNNIALFGMMNFKKQEYWSHEYIKQEADKLGLETVWLIHKGKINSIDELKINLSRISALGKEKIEGFVVKNYSQQLMLGGMIIPILAGKYVSEDFKEVHKKNWRMENTGKGKWEVYKEGFTTQARWLKAIHYLRDCGQLEQSPKDIGKLIKRIQTDITEEEAQNIKEWLFDNFSGEIMRQAVRGFPEWYKDYLMSKVLPNEPGTV